MLKTKRVAVRKRSKLRSLPKPLITYEDMYGHEMCERERNVVLPLVREGYEESLMASKPSIEDALEEASENCFYGPVPVDSVSNASAREVLYDWNLPSLMIIFHSGDLDSARHYLVESLHNPFAPHAVATLVIHEDMVKDFMERVVARMHALDPKIAQHPLFVRSLARLRNINARIFTADPNRVPVELSPIVVLDATHNYMNDGPTGVITLHTYRTPEEASQLYLMEPVKYNSVSVWDEDTASSYEVATLIDCDNLFVNCANVNLDAMQEAFEEGRDEMRLVNGYHLETLTILGKRRKLAFPVGAIII
ncbi:uncharacterized protein LOC115628890 [Scaptodrosophila lebanonensis]|uniref:Uncharacterized protein LOC115628890 n=1 Tax=Drosophila lebanonensis TaxID=7225 RepID=A0A6J2U0K7_DROLE|nr:uncharacterized protein LOC115628890 [Scaptodrosophila lebanonensis]